MPLMSTKSGLKSGVVSRQELFSIIKCFLAHNEVVLGQGVVFRQDGLVRSFTVMYLHTAMMHYILSYQNLLPNIFFFKTCEAYWPDDDETRHQYGPLEVELLRTDSDYATNNLISRDFKVSFIPERVIDLTPIFLASSRQRTILGEFPEEERVIRRSSFDP